MARTTDETIRSLATGQILGSRLITAYEIESGKRLSIRNEDEILSIGWDIFYAIRDDGETLEEIYNRACMTQDTAFTAAAAFLLRHDIFVEYAPIPLAEVPEADDVA